MIWIDYEVQPSSRRCAATGKDLAAGATFYSVLMPAGAQLQRLDYSVEAWQGPPEGAIGWWKSHQAHGERRGPHWAPNDVMLNFFDELESRNDRLDIRYVLALLLVRRRVLRLEESETNDQGQETLVLYCPRRETTYRVAAVVPDEARVEQIQQELARLLD